MEDGDKNGNEDCPSSATVPSLRGHWQHSIASSFSGERHLTAGHRNKLACSHSEAVRDDSNNAHHEAAFCVYYGKSISNQRQGVYSAVPGLFFLSPLLHLNMDSRRLEDSSGCDSSVPEIDLSQHPLEGSAVDVAPTPEQNCGIPEMYLLPSTALAGTNRSDHSGGRATASNEDFELSDRDEHVVSSHYGFNSSDFLNSMPRDAFFFRDTPRGEPMGSESAIQTSTAAGIGLALATGSSSAESSYGDPVEPISDDDAARSSRSRLWLREDVEGADSNTDASVRLDVIVLDSVRPPLVGQAEDTRDVASSVAAVVQVQDVSGVQGHSHTRTFTSRLEEAVRTVPQSVTTAGPQHPWQIDIREQSPRISVADVTVELHAQTRRDFYNSLVGDDDEDDQFIHSSVESTDNEQATAVASSSLAAAAKGSGYQSDHRASSPSVISVTSSVASSKRLEWDSGADIGYDGPKVLYGRLSTLERMAIGSFFRRTDPEGKSALVKDGIGFRQAARSREDDSRKSVPRSRQRQREPAASLEDVVLSIAAETETAVDRVTSEASSRDPMMAAIEDDERDTEDEIAECYGYKKNFASKKFAKAPQMANGDTFVVRVQEQRSSSMTDLSRGNRAASHKSPAMAVRQSRSALDISTGTSDCSRHHRSRRLVSSPGSMVGSSSSSSTVVAVVPPSSSALSSGAAVLQRPELYATATGLTPSVVCGPLCSTALLETPNGLPLRPNFTTPPTNTISASVSTLSVGIMAAAMPLPTDQADDDGDSFDCKLEQTRKLIAQLGTDPRWATQRRWLVETLLEAAAAEFAPNATGMASSRSLRSVAVSNAEVDGDAQGSKVQAIGTTRPEVDENAIPRLGRPLDSDDSECIQEENSCAYKRSSAENAAGESSRGRVPHSKTDSSGQTSQRSTSSRSSPCRLASSMASTAMAARIRVQPRCYVSVSSSDRSESTLETIREQRRRDPRGHHHHRQQQRQQLDQGEASGGTLASSFEFYAMPMSFRGLPRYGNDGPTKRSACGNAVFETGSSVSSGHSASITTTTSAVTNSEETPSEATANAATAAVSYTSETSSNICRKSPRRKTTAAAAPTNSGGQSVKLEGLSVVKELVRRQRESYLRKLRRELDWLERIEAILFGNYGRKRPASHRLAAETVPESAATAIRSKRSNSRSVSKKSHSKQSPATVHPSNRDDKVVHTSASLPSSKDFGQCFPTPHLSENELHEEVQEEKDVKSRRSNSVAIQTSESVLTDSQFRRPPSKSKRSRPIVNVSLTTARAPSINCSIKRYGNGSGIHGSRPTGVRHPPVSWFVPMIDCGRQGQRKSSVPSSRDSVARGRADGANSSVGSSATTRAIKDVSLQEAFRLYKVDMIRRSIARQVRVKEQKHTRIQQPGPRMVVPPKKAGSFKRVTKPLAISDQHHNPQVRFLTERQMRDHTERLYRALSEVAERQELKRREDSYRTNRQMAEVFKKRLQENVLRGKVSIPMAHKCT